MKKLPLNSAGLSNTYVKGKTTKFFSFATERYNLFLKLPMKIVASSILCINIFFVKELRQWRQIREAMKQSTVNYGKN
jgi:hypothetical protein